MMDLVKLSKTMAHALRHAPDEYGLTLDADGWVEIDALIAGLRRKKAWQRVTQADLEAAAGAGEKPRYELQAGRIRARHGHSVEQKITYQASPPPAVLYHGTSQQALALILQEGLQPMNRQYVHLTSSMEEAAKVGGRKQGQTVILRIQAAQAHADGLAFYQTSEVIWLADSVPARYITLPQ